MVLASATRHQLGGYQEFAALNVMATFCESIWWYRTPRGLARAVHRRLPDLAVNVQFAYRRSADGRISDPRLTFGGPLGSPQLEAFSRGQEMVAIKIKLECGTAILDLSPNERSHGDIELSETQPRLAAEVLERLVEARSMESATQVLASTIGRLAQRRSCGRSVIATRALDIVRRTSGRCTVERIAEQLSISPAHLRRSVDGAIGLSLKRYARVIRMLNAITTADAYPITRSLGWASIAVDTGFYDQSHLIRECQDLCGLTPVQIMDERRSEIMEDPNG